MNGKRMLCFWIGLCLLVSLYGCAAPELTPESGESDSNGSAEWMATESSELPDLASTVVDGSFQRSPMTDTYSWDLDGGELYTGSYLFAPFDRGCPATIDNVVEWGEFFWVDASAHSSLHSVILFVAKTNLRPNERHLSLWDARDHVEALKLCPPSESGRAEWEALLASWGIVKGEHYSPTTEVPPYFEQQPGSCALWDVSLFDFYQIDISIQDILSLCMLADDAGYFVFIHLPSTRSMEAMRLDRLGW